MGEKRHLRGGEKEMRGAVAAGISVPSQEMRATLAAIVESSDDAIIGTALGGIITTWNRGAEALYGYTSEEAIGRHIDMLTPPERQHELDGVREQLRVGQRIERQETVAIRKDGRCIDVSFSMSPIVDAQGCIVGTASITRDVTEQRRAREALEESEHRFRLLFASNPQPMWVYDIQALCFLEVNAAAVERYGYARAEFLAMRITDIQPEEDALRLMQELASLQGPIRQSGEWRHRRKDGSMIDVEITSHPLEFAGRPAALVLAQDITERKRAQNELRRQALHDALTGLPNRALFRDRLDQAILIARRTGEPVTLLVMDLDGFKEINDTFGHGHGDILLQQLSMRLRRQVRESDTVARLGGDEFAIVLPATDATGAMRTVNAIQTALEEPFCIEGRSLSVGASIGISVCPDQGDTSSALLRRADVAMYLAKRAHSGYAVYTSERDHHSPGELALAGRLREAIEHDQLVLHYQPKYNLRTLTPVGRGLESEVETGLTTSRPTGVTLQVEALVRWNHPERGLLAPSEFIPIAERMGMIRPLTRWVLRAALRQCRIWYDGGRTVNISVNLSARNLQEEDLVETLRHLIRQCAISPTWLTIEITETTIMADPERAMQVLTGLHGLGVGISIDDFGTGYSSLAYLKRLPVDEIKIDRSFVQEMCGHENDSVIVRSVIDLGHNLGLRVVAEGVEDRVSLEMLSSMGCDLVQGFYLGRPQPAYNGRGGEMAPPGTGAGMEPRVIPLGHGRVGVRTDYDNDDSTSLDGDDPAGLSAPASHHAWETAGLSG